MKKSPIAKFAMCAVILLSSNSYAEMQLGVGVESFYWDEQINGRHLLDETGPRWAIYLKSSQLQPNAGGFSVYQAKAVLGRADYDGALQDGTPIQSTTDYAGLTQQLDYHYRIPFANTRFDIIPSLGWDMWRRAIKNPLGGSQFEDYSILYLSLGGELGRLNNGWYAGTAVKYPIYTNEDAHLNSYGYSTNPNLTPGKAASLTAVLGYRVPNSRFDISLYMDGYRFPISPYVEVDNGVKFRQPESMMRLMGLKVMFTF